MAKLTNTSETAIAITSLVMNLSTALSRFFYFCVHLRKQHLFPAYTLSKAIDRLLRVKINLCSQEA